MADSLMTTVIDPAAGRLPTPSVAAWPISQKNFDRLTRRWRELNLWLSLWNADGEMIDCDDVPGALGEALRAANNPFYDALAAFARVKASEQMTQGRVKVADPSDLGPLQPAIALIAVPVRSRQRYTGTILAMFAPSGHLGDEVEPLCDLAGFDSAAVTQFRRLTGTVPKDIVPNLAGLLRLTVELARENDIAGDEIAILTSNLENTYEELHLIYEISQRMSLPQNPIKMLERVGRQLLGVCRAECVAFLLNPESFGSDGGESNSDNITSLEGERQERRPQIVCLDDQPPSVLNDLAVQVGLGAPRLEDLQRLADSLSLDGTCDAGYVLLNMAARRRELRWASSWLKHLVVLPLCQDGRRLGVFYAINCVDDRDFTSVDVQLLKAVADRLTAALQNLHLYGDLTKLLMGLIHALVNSVDAKDTYTFGHSERVAYFSRSLSQALGMSPVECQRVYLAGLLHDVGKIGVPDAILCKPGKLTNEEFEALKKHPEIGERILSHIAQIRDLLPGVLYHHERMDGRGYPHRLAARRIPLLGRIICLADSFDAMTTNRTYRAALPVALAIAEIRRCSGTQFDPVLAEKFLSCDPQRLYEGAHAFTTGSTDVGRIGTLASALSGPTLSWASSEESQAESFQVGDSGS